MAGAPKPLSASPAFAAYRLHGYQHPLLHLKRLGPAGVFEGYAEQFEAIWAEARPAVIPGSVLNGAR